MPTIRVRISLPYLLRLTDGEYQTGPAGESVHLSEGPLEETSPSTTASATFEHPDPVALNEIERIRQRDADH
jgi:hypothetical protein